MNELFEMIIAQQQAIAEAYRKGCEASYQKGLLEGKIRGLDRAKELIYEVSNPEPEYILKKLVPKKEIDEGFCEGWSREIAEEVFSDLLAQFSRPKKEP